MTGVGNSAPKPPLESRGRRLGTWPGMRPTASSRLRRLFRLAFSTLIVVAGLLAWCACGGSSPGASAPPGTPSSPPSARTTSTALTTSTAQTTSTSETARSFLVSSWTRGDLTSLAGAVKAGAVGEVCTDWWHVRSDGSLAADSTAVAGYVAEAHALGLKVLATITNRPDNQKPFDPALAKPVIATAQARARFAGVLVDLCAREGYDGIDIDFESLDPADRDAFSAFMEALAERLHAAGKILSVAVYDKQTEFPTGSEAGARAAEDYKAIGAVADEFKVLTFGEHGSFTGPGPIASPEYVAKVLDYAQSQVDPSKVFVAVPFFGFDWGGRTPRYLTWTAAQRLIAQYGPAVKRSASGEPYFEYQAAGVTHTVYFQDRTSIQRKTEFALDRKPEIGGMSIWVMGIEDPGFWPAIGGLLP